MSRPGIFPHLSERGTNVFTFKVQVATFGVFVTLSVVLETAADWQLFDLTGDPVSDVVVFTRARPLPLFTTTFYTLPQLRCASETGRTFLCLSYRRRHGAGGVFVASCVVSGGAGVDGLTAEPVSSVTFRTGAAHLFSCLRAFGSFSTTTVPDPTHVQH